MRFFFLVQWCGAGRAAPGEQERPNEQQHHAAQKPGPIGHVPTLNKGIQGFNHGLVEKGLRAEFFGSWTGSSLAPTGGARKGFSLAGSSERIFGVTTAAQKRYVQPSSMWKPQAAANRTRSNRARP